MLSDTQVSGLLNILRHGAGGRLMMRWQTYRSLISHGYVEVDWGHHLGDDDYRAWVQVSDLGWQELDEYDRTRSTDRWIIMDHLAEQAMLEDQARDMRLAWQAPHDRTDCWHGCGEVEA